MERPVVDRPVPDHEIPTWNMNYLYGCPTPADPTIVWGTDVDCTDLQAYLKQLNAEGPVLITPVHVLLRATACAMARHPQFNRRVLRRHVYQYKQINLLLPFRKRQPAETDVMVLEQVDRKPLVEIARELWQHHQDAARGEFVFDGQASLGLSRRMTRRLFYRMHLWLANGVNLPAREHSKRHRTAAAVVNYFGFKGAAPLRSFKPSRAPYDGLPVNITMGAIEPRPAALDGEVVVRSIAPLFVRADHRIVDAHEIGLFAATLREFLANPAAMEFGPEAAGDGEPALAPAAASEQPGRVPR
jgi:hypothetical protein